MQLGLRELLSDAPVPHGLVFDDARSNGGRHVDFLEDVREENGGPTESQVNTSGKEVVSKSVIPVENP